MKHVLFLRHFMHKKKSERQIEILKVTKQKLSGLPSPLNTDIIFQNKL